MYRDRSLDVLILELWREHLELWRADFDLWWGDFVLRRYCTLLVFLGDLEVFKSYLESCWGFGRAKGLSCSIGAQSSLSTLL